MKRVLVTGASGFIGRAATRALLARGYEVHAIASRAPSGFDSSVTVHVCDLLKRSASEVVATARPTHLLHLAWCTTPGSYLMSLENFSWTRASFDLVQAFVAAGGERIVVAGTCAEYDWRYGHCSEALTPLVPATPYGACKGALRDLLAAYAKSVSVSLAWGRIFHLYGPGEHPQRLVASVIRALLAGREARCTDGKQIRDYIYVEDAGDAFAALVDSTFDGAVNVASGRPVRLRDFVATIAEEIARPDLLALGAVAAPANDPPVLTADVSRLEKVVGWSPRFDHATGIREAIRWWRERPETLAYDNMPR